MKKCNVLSNMHAALLLQSMGFTVDYEQITPVILYEYSRPRKMRIKQIFCWKALTDNNTYVYLQMKKAILFPRWEKEYKNLEEQPARHGCLYRFGENEDDFIYAYLTDDEDMIRFERTAAPAAEVTVLKEFWHN